MDRKNPDADISAIIPESEPIPPFQQQMAEERFMKAIREPIPCRPDPAHCWALESPETPGFALMAANLTLAGLDGSDEDRAELWDCHGAGNCLSALHVADAHPELLPEPTFVLAQEHELYERHRAILMMAAGRQGWRTMPAGGQEAIRDGLVAESDPTWMMSDDPRVSNGFTLTEPGRRIMIKHHHVCGCAGCALMPHGPVVTDGEWCGNCQAGIQQYGAVETAQGTSCRSTPGRWNR